MSNNQYPPAAMQVMQAMQSGQWPCYNECEFIGQISPRQSMPQGFEYRMVQGKTPMLVLNVLLYETWQTQMKGVQERHLEVKCQIFGQAAQQYANQLQPGMIIYFRGALQVQNFQAKQGPQAGQWKTSVGIVLSRRQSVYPPLIPLGVLPIKQKPQRQQQQPGMQGMPGAGGMPGQMPMQQPQQGMMPMQPQGMPMAGGMPQGQPPMQSFPTTMPTVPGMPQQPGMAPMGTFAPPQPMQHPGMGMPAAPGQPMQQPMGMMPMQPQGMPMAGGMPQPQGMPMAGGMPGMPQGQPQGMPMGGMQPQQPQQGFAPGGQQPPFQADDIPFDYAQ